MSLFREAWVRGGVRDVSFVRARPRFACMVAEFRPFPGAHACFVRCGAVEHASRCGMTQLFFQLGSVRTHLRGTLLTLFVVCTRGLSKHYSGERRNFGEHPLHLCKHLSQPDAPYHPPHPRRAELRGHALQGFMLMRALASEVWWLVSAQTECLC